jgi:hypothetical protein
MRPTETSIYLVPRDIMVGHAAVAGATGRGTLLNSLFNNRSACQQRKRMRWQWMLRRSSSGQQVRKAAAAGPEGEAAPPPPGYAFDTGSGMYVDASGSTYYDARSGGFYSSVTGLWYSVDAGGQFVEWPVQHGGGQRAA